MRELKVLGDGHLKLDFAELQDFFEQDWAEMARSQLKAIIEQALLAECDRYLELGYYEHAPLSRLDDQNSFDERALVTKLGLLARLRIPGTRNGFHYRFLPSHQPRQQLVNSLIFQTSLPG